MGDRQMSLAKKVAHVVNKIAPCTWVEVQAEMPEYTEMQIRRALMNATAQRYVFIDTAKQSIPGRRHRPVGVYTPNPVWFMPRPKPVPRPARPPRMVAAPRPVRPPSPEPILVIDDEDEEPTLTPDKVVMLAMANRHPLESWLTA